jgi:uncharacterized membrane protein
MFWTKEKKTNQGKRLYNFKRNMVKANHKETLTMISVILGWTIWIIVYIFILRPYVMHIWFEVFKIPIYHAVTDFVLIFFIGLLGMGVIGSILEKTKK